MIEPKLIKIEAVDDYDVGVAEETASNVEPGSGIHPIRAFMRRIKSGPEVRMAHRVVRGT